MNRMWDTIMLPIIESVNAKYIIEVGSDSGINTKNILKYCLGNDAKMLAIDPFPKFDVNEYKEEFGEKFEIYEELSLNILSNLENYDVIILDGDHNWYTVYNELKTIEKTFQGKKFPIIFLHDTGWPYARRDLYYNPKTIPAPFLHSYAKKGISLDQELLDDEKGLNHDLNNAIHEKTPKNGVLSGIEDFISQSERKLYFRKINIFHGLGIISDDDQELKNIIDSNIQYGDLLELLETERLKVTIDNNFKSKINNKYINKLENQVRTLTSEKKDLKHVNHKYNLQLSNNYKKLNAFTRKLEIKNNDINTIKNSFRYKAMNIIAKAAKPSKYTFLWPYLILKLYFNKNKQNKSTDNKKDLLKFNLSETNRILNILNKKVSIIIPIYNAYNATKRCIESVLENSHNYELILIDDCSTDDRISELLGSFKNNENVKIIKNNENKGFVKTVNIGFDNSKYDVISLNSDTIVTPNWINNLKIAAYNKKNIATVTPLSNAAGPFSVPKFNSDNEIPSNLSLNEMSQIVRNVSTRKYIKVPTGHGFCMFIRKKALNDIGQFDEIFGRGYGEENDFCMRAIKKGWINVIDESTYIYHKRSASFSEDKKKLVNEHRKIIDKRYPEYANEIKKFIDSNKLKKIVNNVGSEINNDIDENELTKKRILYVIHAAGGGTPKTNKDLMKNIEKSFDCYLLIGKVKKLELFRYINQKMEKIGEWSLNVNWNGKNFYSDDFKTIYFNVLVNFNIDLVHIRHLIFHSFDLPKISKQLNIPVVLSSHDFYFICPSTVLLDDNREYCGGKCNSNNKDCYKPMKIMNNLPNLKNFVNVWRKNVSCMFHNVDVFVTTSNIVKDIFLFNIPYLNEKKFEIIEHGRDFETSNEKFFSYPSKDKPIKILFIGNLTYQKGYEVIKSLKKQDKDSKLEFNFLGKIPKELKIRGIYHGTYNRDDLHDHLRRIKPSFIGIFSIWPETYCHTLSEAWSAKIPVLASKIGVLEERIFKNDGGWFIDYKNPAKSYEKILEISNDIDEYKRVQNGLKNIDFKNTKEMSEEYLTIYRDLLDELN
ncbi:Glycosyltransferase AglI [Candidatus Methanobinarius endosymbioticus]|uniref:Glycosyltransferase AglI n=1 Tax=Candidatus Methanobinarius endosymbioticus TaxID=2006182 RepID=A0A366MAP9_9EURY|nr:Glycosyltransferase AglI [Candidatus Methanobinarius endosymbioticus]